MMPGPRIINQSIIFIQSFFNKNGEYVLLIIGD